MGSCRPHARDDEFGSVASGAREVTESVLAPRHPLNSTAGSLGTEEVRDGLARERAKVHAERLQMVDQLRDLMDRILRFKRDQKGIAVVQCWSHSQTLRRGCDEVARPIGREPKSHCKAEQKNMLHRRVARHSRSGPRRMHRPLIPSRSATMPDWRRTPLGTARGIVPRQAANRSHPSTSRGWREATHRVRDRRPESAHRSRVTERRFRLADDASTHGRCRRFRRRRTSGRPLRRSRGSACSRMRPIDHHRARAGR
jgi:hypothetical protein